MPTTNLRRRRGPKPDRRRALELLASCRNGCTEAMMLAHGFTVPQMVELLRAGLATATAECVVAGRRTIEVARVRITNPAGACWKAGEHVLEGG
jgi:hypothetical protein